MLPDFGAAAAAASVNWAGCISGMLLLSVHWLRDGDATAKE